MEVCSKSSALLVFFIVVISSYIWLQQSSFLRRHLGLQLVVNEQLMEIEAGPSPEYETTRQQMRRDLAELLRLARDRLQGPKEQELLEHVKEYVVGMEQSLARLEEQDGWQGWRRRESERLTKLVQNRIHRCSNWCNEINQNLSSFRLQNPANCKKAKKLVCHLNYVCGFGCQVNNNH